MYFKPKVDFKLMNKKDKSSNSIHSFIISFLVSESGKDSAGYDITNKHIH